MKDAPVISPHETYGSVTGRSPASCCQSSAAGVGGSASRWPEDCCRYWARRCSGCFTRAWASGASNMPVAWGTAIINYVWWIEIAQGGTFISAVLLLFHQKWRTSVNRFTEAMTLFAPRVRLPIPAGAHGPTAVRILPGALSEHAGDVAAVRQPARVGLLCSFDLRHDLRAVLVSGHDPRLGDDAGFDRQQVAAPDLRCRLLRLAQLGDALAPL